MQVSSKRWSWIRRSLALGASIGVLWAAPGCGPREQAPPNVLLISMDTVRADHLSLYGYHRPTSPHIDALAATATVYERAKSSSNWSIPSHASMFTGKDPFQHGAHRTKGVETETVPARGGPAERPRVVKNPLDGTHRTLAEVFSAEGYATGAIVANDGYLGPKWGLARGFQHYDAQRADADAINARATAWLESIGDAPFFLFVNYMDAHQPYNIRPRAGLLPDQVDPDPELPARLAERSKEGRPLPEDQVRRMMGQYDTGIANLDAAIGDLVRTLKGRGLYDDTILVLTSDHGESFAEHGPFVLHANDIWETEVAVPLLVKGPRQSDPQRIAALTSISDIPRLILRLLPPAFATAHEDQFPNLPGNHPVISENHYSLKLLEVSPEYDRVRTAVYEGRYKYIHSSDGRSELYDLEADPGETTDIVARHPDIAAALERMLAEYIAERGRAQRTGEAPSLTEEERENLRALGYVD